MSERNMNDRIVEQLEREPVPQLSPFFATRVESSVRSFERRRTSPVIIIYWFALLVAAIFAIESVASGSGHSLSTLVMVPAGFALWFWRDSLLELATGIAALLFPR